MLQFSGAWTAVNLTQYFAIGVDASQALPATYDPTLVVASYLVATLAG